MSHAGLAAETASRASPPSGARPAHGGDRHPTSPIRHVVRMFSQALGLKNRRYGKLYELCAPDIEFWRAHQMDYASYLLHLEGLNKSHAALFVFDICNGKITHREKIEPNAATRHLLATRVPAYLQFFEQVVQTLAPELDVSFGMLLEDLATGHPHVPLLSFQKAATDNLLLAPEIDTLILKFYESSDFVDDLDFAAKRAAAIFVGSTTGVDPLTGRSVTIRRGEVDNAPTERIRAAKRFQGQTNITFRLPGVVQCHDPETEAYLRSFEFCHGGPVSWKQQYGYRFIISIDGNGATCSRLALALRSRSVLLKYSSPYVLFYTRALKPLVHYLPVADDEDVINYVSALRKAPPNGHLPFREIQENANRFYRRFLGRTVQHRYTAVLLNELEGLLRGQPNGVIRRRIDTLDSALDIMAHVGNFGDRWYWPSQNAGTPGTGEVIEAFTIRNDLSGGSARDFEYQCLLQDGTLGAWLPSGTLCGGRGLGKPLAGFRMRVSSEFTKQYALRYRASFVGEPQTSWIDQGSWCASTNRSPLESFEVDMAPRGLRGALRRLRSAWSREGGSH